MECEPDAEVELTGGRMTAGVVRVGDTVRRPTGAHSAFVHRLLGLLEKRDVEAAPRFLGLDGQGREILSFHPGWVPPNLEWRRWTNDQLVFAAKVVRNLHDATASSELAMEDGVVCHGDLSPCNFVFVSNQPRFLIDFDRAHPGSRKSDLAYMAWMWLVGPEEEEPHAPAFVSRLAQLPVLLDAYGLDDRSDFADAIETEQREILAMARERGNAGGIRWLESEIAFLRSHSALINLAARTH
jgi:hypothetical protein